MSDIIEAMQPERTSLDELKAIESTVDETVQQLPVLKLPIRVLLSQLITTLFHLLHGIRANASAEKQLKGNSLITRLSYVAPLLSRRSQTPTGANARDVSDAYLESDANGEQLKLLISYAQLSEVMPGVHRGYYEVSGDRTRGIELRHSSSRFAN